MPFWYRIPLWSLVVLSQDSRVYSSWPVGNVYVSMQWLCISFKWRVLIWLIERRHVLLWLAKYRRLCTSGLCVAPSKSIVWMRVQSSSTLTRKSCVTHAWNEGRNGLAWLEFIINSMTGMQQRKVAIVYRDIVLVFFLFMSWWDGLINLIFVRFRAGSWLIAVAPSHIYLSHFIFLINIV